MSGESIGGVAVVGAVGGVAVLGAAAAAGCVYAVAGVGRAVGAGAAVAVGSSMSALGRHLEHRQEQREALHAERIRWERAIRDVATRNARIAALEAALDDAGDDMDVELPAPTILGGQGLAELEDWCLRMDPQLAKAESNVVEASTRALLRRASPADGSALVGAEALLGDDDPGRRSASGPWRWDRQAILTDLTRVLSRLAVEASDDERCAVAAAARRVLGSPGRTEARNRLDDVRVRIDEVNAEAATRRDEAERAAALLQPLAAAAESRLTATTSAEMQGVRAALLDVLAGRRRLTDELTDRAVAAAKGVHGEADRIYVRRTVTEALGELGYAVEEGFQTAVPRRGVLQVRRSEWSAHGVRMVLDEEKQELRAFVVRTEADTGWDKGRVDAEREKQWCSDLDKLTARLAERGLRLAVRERREPGTREVPLVRQPHEQARPAEVTVQSSVRQASP